MFIRSNPLLWRTPRTIWGYGIAVLTVSVAPIIWRWPALQLRDAPVSLFLCAVLLSAWFGGVGPALLATALSGLAFYHYLQPPIPRLAIFVVSTLLVGSMSAALRSAAESLRGAHESLIETVQKLRKTNEALQAESLERKRGEEGLRRSEAYLAEAQRLSHTGSWASVPATGDIRFLSEECYRVLGFNPRNGIPGYETFLERIHPDDQANVVESVETAGREKAGFELDYRIVHPGGEIRDLHVVGHPVLSSPGDVVEFVGTVMDVTERRRADEERERLRQVQAELARINRATTVGELTASLAHEVNQPIAAAVTNANTCLRWLAGDTPNLEEARAAATRVVTDGRRAAEIISRVRLLFKKGTPERKSVDVNEVVREMVVLLRGEAARHNISVRTELAGDLPLVMGDRVQLQQVMMNLMSNGIDAMKDADGTRELAIKSQQEENDQLVVSVSDTGVGLPPEADQIFKAFFTTKVNGTGMGLSISRSIVESLGGRLWAGGNSPRGARFHFTLPTKAEAHE